MSAEADSPAFRSDELCRDLGLRVYTPKGFRQFLQTPLPTFDGRTPLQMIEQGKAGDVIAALTADYEGLGF